MSHFGYIGHHLIVAIIDHIPNGIYWLGDVPWGHFMTHVITIITGQPNPSNVFRHDLGLHRPSSA